jgi:hypothetical protein
VEGDLLNGLLRTPRLRCHPAPALVAPIDSSLGFPAALEKCVAPRSKLMADTTRKNEWSTKRRLQFSDLA